MAHRPTVYIVDDDAAVRQSLAELIGLMRLDSRAFASGEAFLRETSPNRPGCLIVDLKMPGMSGLDLQQALAANDAPLPVVVITAHGDVPLCVQAMKAGAVDFLEKPYDPRRLRESIWEALETDRLRLARRSPRPPSADPPLTTQERSVLRAIINGETNRDIATRLDVSVRTVQLRRSALRQKLGAKTRAEFFARARQLLDPIEP